MFREYDSSNRRWNSHNSFSLFRSLSGALEVKWAARSIEPVIGVSPPYCTPLLLTAVVEDFAAGFGGATVESELHVRVASAVGCAFPRQQTPPAGLCRGLID